MVHNSQVLAGVLPAGCGTVGTGMLLAELGTTAHLRNKTGASPCTDSADSCRRYKIHQSGCRMLDSGDEMDIQPGLRNSLPSLLDGG